MWLFQGGGREGDLYLVTVCTCGPLLGPLWKTWLETENNAALEGRSRDLLQPLQRGMGAHLARRGWEGVGNGTPLTGLFFPGAQHWQI